MLKKGNIIKHGGMALIYAACIAVGGIAIYDANFDHTKDVCLFGKLNHFHQTKEMEKDYLKQYNRKVEFAYKHDYFSEEDQYAYAVPLSNGAIDYVIPDGYNVDSNFKVTKENGKYSAIVPDEHNSDIPVMRVK